MYVEEFPPCVRSTTCFAHRATLKHLVIPSVTVDLQGTGEALQKLLRPLLATIGLEIEYHRLPLAPRPAPINPQVTGGGPTTARSEHRHGRLIGLQIALFEQFVTQHLYQRF